MVKRRCWILAAAAALCCAHAFASAYPTAEQLQAAIAEAASLLRAEGLSVEVRDAQKENVARPLMAAGLSLTKGACFVFYNAKPVKELGQFFDTVTDQDLPIWLNAIAVHEVTHCFEQRIAYVQHRFDKVLPPKLSQDDLTVQGYLSVVNSGAIVTWGEALADIAMVLYFERTVPERWAQFASALAAMRENLISTFPSHNTSVWLRNIISAKPAVPKDQSIFEAAFSLRRYYGPTEEGVLAPIR